MARDGQERENLYPFRNAFLILWNAQERVPEIFFRNGSHCNAFLTPKKGLPFPFLEDRTFQAWNGAILALERAILALERAILKERERKAFFGGQERVPVRSVPEKNFRNALLRSTEIRNAFRNADRFFRSCPSLPPPY